MNTIDLQVHSTVSDGRHAPAEVVTMAKERGITIMALTDHDAVGGIEEALNKGRELGVRVIPSIEISVEEQGAHILGYGIDYKNHELLMCLEDFRKARIVAARQMIENLKKDGFVVEWEDVLKEATGTIINRPHISRAVLHRRENKEKLGGIATVHDFIKTHLADGGKNHVPSKHLGAQRTIEIIHHARGVAVWSHPAIHCEGNYGELGAFFQELKKMGLDGLEVFTSAHTEDDAEFVQNLALTNRLVRTAGSDFHEADSNTGSRGGPHPARFVGDYETYGFSLEDFVPRLDEAILKKTA